MKPLLSKNTLQCYFSFHAGHQPYMVRHSYTHELRSAMTYPLAAALAEGAFTGIVAAKYFDASPTLIAVITAAPMFGNIMALLWAEMAKTRRKVPFVNWLQLGVISCIAAVALTRLMPPSSGGWVFAGLIILARVLVAGIVTIRSVIWRYNYPRHLRGQIIARITVIATMVLAGATYFGARWLDRDPGAYIYLYPGAALIGAIGIWQFSYIRVRHEERILREQQLYTPRPESLAQTDETNVLNYIPRRIHQSLRGFFADSLQVLREDSFFRRYQRWQFISGAGFMMMTPPLLLLISQKLTDPKRDYALATFVLQIIPMLTSILCAQLWAPLFDRLHVTMFRVVQSFVSVAALSMLASGALISDAHPQAALWTIGIGQLLIGVTNSAGNLAMNLGHNDFAPPERAATYMGVHVMLNGLRGFIAPFVGVWLYATFVGRGVFIISALLNVSCLFGFYAMSRHAPRKVQRHRPGSGGPDSVPPGRDRHPPFQTAQAG
ncbi:MAG: MFS transporter [Phycisphaeraceae bacterium]|nr:MFS transporter [Phycisphaeraceae bacterium]